MSATRREEEIVVHPIISQFFAVVPLRNFTWKCGVAAIGFQPEEQKEIIDKTVCSDLCQRYPPTLSYQKKFMKAIMQQCEETGVEIYEGIYELYAKMVSKTNEQEKCYKSYILPSKKVITLQESNELVSLGTTGLHTWPASQYLAEWLIQNHHIIQQKKVVELGSGCGLLGLVTLNECHPKHYYFSDCHQNVLHTLVDNVKINCSTQCNTGSTVCHNLQDRQNHCECSETDTDVDRQADELTVCECNQSCEVHKTYDNMEYSCVFHCGTVSVLRFDWEDVDSANHLQNIDVDIIIAADVVFDPCIVTHLVSVLSKLLTPPRHDCMAGTVAYVASTIRNEQTFQFFLSSLEAQLITVTVIEAEPNTHVFYYDKSCVIKLLKLSKSSQVSEHLI
uniref:Protein FAM86A-like n=1 Tax=Saccoglossus kowalevskii TaxID=10224 RepID=A0ABM0M0A1_SACKO|nr:PREDICTED: protein FAM86A-like [Saccoglossus kowalevskii]